MKKLKAIKITEDSLGYEDWKAGKKGKWITVRGTHIFIVPGGKSAETLIKEHEKSGGKSPKQRLKEIGEKKGVKFNEQQSTQRHEEEKEQYKLLQKQTEEREKTGLSPRDYMLSKLGKKLAKEKEEKEPEKKEESKTEKLEKELNEILKNPDKKISITPIEPKTKKQVLEKIEKVKEKERVEKLKKKHSEIDEKAKKITELQQANAKVREELKEFQNLIKRVKKLKKSRNFSQAEKSRLLKRLMEIQSHVKTLGVDIRLTGTTIKTDYIGNLSELLDLFFLRKDLTNDSIELNQFKKISLDMDSEDFTVLQGPITRSGPFEYEKNGVTVIYYKDWNNIKDVFSKIDYIPLKAQTDPGSHHAEIMGYATNFQPNDETEQMFAETVIFNDIENLTDVLNPENGYAVSIGFKDEIKDNVQMIEYVDHLAMALKNADKDRCSTAGGKSCYQKKIN